MNVIELLSPFDRVRALRFDDAGLSLLDQRLLPQISNWVPMPDVDAVVEAIRALIVRGAPAIAARRTDAPARPQPRARVWEAGRARR